ncbi:MAG: acyltransferase [Kofleriaceae bacterium]
MGANPPRRIPSLDGLRALSILLVLLSHLLGTHNFPVGPRALGTVGDFGYTGVKVFFVISGYLITTLLLREFAKTGTISLRGFFRRRVWRIFPAFYVFIGAVLIAAAIGVVSIRTDDLLSAVTYTMNYHYDRSWKIGHLWSLSIEEQFYLVWPLLLLAASPRRVVPVSVAMIGLALVARGVAWFGFHSDNLVEEAFPCVMDAIAVGCLMAGLAPRLDASARYQRFLRSPGFWLVPLVVPLTQLPFHPALDYTVSTTASNLAIAVVIDRVVRIPDDPVGRLLNWRVLAWLGTLSYSLYLWQEPFLNHLGRSWFQRFPQNLVAALACALASFYLVEQPVLRWRARREAARAAAAPA